MPCVQQKVSSFTPGKVPQFSIFLPGFQTRSLTRLWTSFDLIAHSFPLISFNFNDIVPCLISKPSLGGKNNFICKGEEKEFEERNVWVSLCGENGKKRIKTGNGK